MKSRGAVAYALGFCFISACGKSAPPPRTASPQPVSTPSAQVIGPSQEADLAVATSSSDACNALPSLEAACQRELEAFTPGCGPADCALETVASAHGVSVHLLTIDETLCDGECDGPAGILGQSVGVTYKDDCGHSETNSAATVLVLVQSGNRLWPATRLRSSRSIWHQSDTSLSEIELVDRANLVWTLHTRSTAVIEPEGDAGGEITTQRQSREFVWLDANGPHLRHEVTLLSETHDNTSASRMDGESEAEFTARSREYDAALESDSEAPEAPPEIPALSDLPQCVGGNCPLLCDTGPPTQ